MHVGVLLDEARQPARPQSQRVLPDQDLRVAAVARPDPDRGDVEGGGDLRGDVAGDHLHDDGERARFLECGRIGQDPRLPLTAAQAYADTSPAPGGGLVVVGSHVGQTTRQLSRLIEHRGTAHVVELQVTALLRDSTRATELDRVVSDVVSGLGISDVVLHTSRLLVRTDDAAASLDIARAVSAAVVDVVRRTLAQRPPRFVIAKGGITSSDVATHGLQIRHAVVRGPMLPGIISLWQPVDGPARGIPYVVFAGNVGDDEALVDVVRILSTNP